MNSTPPTHIGRPLPQGASTISAPREQFELLLVEDNSRETANLRRALGRSLRSNFRVTHVEWLGQAIGALRRTSFDIVLLDLFLPDSSGIITLTELSRHAPEVPVVVLSSVDNELLALEVLAEGAQDFIVKSQIDGTVLPRAVRNALERARSEQGLRMLARAGEDLARSLEQDEVLHQIAQVAVTGFADLCIVELRAETGDQRQVIAASSELAQHEDAIESLRGRPSGRGTHPSVTLVPGTDSSQLIDVVTPDTLEMLANLVEGDYTELQERVAEISRLKLKSAIFVPLLGETETLGSISLFMSERGRGYTRADMDIAQQFARMASRAIENAKRYEQAQEQLQARDERLARLSHDVRTPLTAISAGVGLLGMRTEERLDPEERALLANVRRNVTRLAEMLGDLLMGN